MHTPIPQDGQLYREGAMSSGTESSEGGKRQNVTSSRRKSVKKADPAPKKRRLRKSPAPQSWSEAGAAFLVRNQIRMSAILMLTLAAVHKMLPELRPWTTKFYSISYYNPSNGLYGKGIDDLYLVFFWIVAFTFLRSTILEYVLLPLAKMGGINTKKGLVRFSEQAWLVVYYVTFWSIGMYLLWNSPYLNSLDALWDKYPEIEVDGVLKWYYAAQFAFWLQQIFVLNIEEHRKDHYQMFAHHIITCFLIAGSYTHHLMRIGHVILCVMDVIDILLSSAKLLKYLGYSTICDYAFGVFLIGWVLGRHGLYNVLTYSVAVHAPRIIPSGCYDMKTRKLIPGRTVDWKTLYDTFLFRNDAVCFDDGVRGTFVSLLVALQIITLIWLYMILRVAWRVVTGAGADDTRSEDEAEDEDEIVKEDLPAPSEKRNGVRANGRRKE